MGATVENGQRTRRVWNLGRRLAAIVLVGIVLGFAIVIVLQSLAQRKTILAESDVNRSAIAELIATQISGGVKFKKADAIAKGYNAYLNDKTAALASIAVFGPDDTILAHADADKLPVADLTALLPAAKDGIAQARKFLSVTPEHMVIFVPVMDGPTEAAKQIGTLGMAWAMAPTNAAIRGQIVTAILIAAGVLVVQLAAILFVIRRTVSRPIIRIVGLIGADTTVEQLESDLGPVVGRNDEIGDIGRALVAFSRAGAEVQRLRDEQGHADERNALERQRLAQRLAANFKESVGSVAQALASSINEMRAAADRLSTAADETEAKSEAAVTNAEQTSQNVQTVASAAEELTASVGEISRQVTESAKFADNAAASSEQSNDRIASLNDSVTKIGQVAQLISDIASQTNLLALNATIEAARAGEMGKGFAVVASEVKNLANQTGKATEDISEQITAVQQATEGTVQVMKEIITRIHDIHSLTAAISSAVVEQQTATQEIARSAQDAASSTQKVFTNVREITGSAIVTRDAAAIIQQRSSDLLAETDRLSGEVAKFLNSLAAA